MTIRYTKGYAGTGKSTELLNLIQKLPSTSVILCPTHKACKRLWEGIISKNIITDIEIKTIHSLLGWIPTINEDAKHINHIETTAKLDRELEEYTDIVIDEGGMMSEEMLMDITAKLDMQNNFETDHITIHIFLDPYQLLPVKGRQIQIDEETTTTLTVQHRAESPDVVNLFTKFVNYLEGTNKKDLTTPYSDNVIHVTNVRKFKKGDRLLAFTNEAVGNYNVKIAKVLGIKSFEGQEVQLGSMLDTVICDEFIEPDLDDLLFYYTEERLILQNSKISPKWLESSLQALIDEKAIEFITSGHLVYPVIVGIDKANKARNNAKEKAIENKKNFRHVYALNRAYTMDYSFASTVHKAQGSEFDRVWIDKNDIKKSILGNYFENYARLMYVAISRAKKKVFILE